MSDEAGRLIMELRSHGPQDRTPMQMISADKLAHYMRIEEEVLHLRKVVQAVRLAVVGDCKDKPAEACAPTCMDAKP